MDYRITCPVFYVPWTGTKPIEASEHLGASWLRAQPGDPLVLVGEMRDYRDSELPAALGGVAVFGARSRTGSWYRGPVLAAWPDETLLDRLDRLGRQVTAACVIEMGERPFVRSWLRVRRATSVTSAHQLAPRPDSVSPVVRTAMRHIGTAVNHANGIAGRERDRVVSGLQALVRAGHTFDLDGLAECALESGFHTDGAVEVRRLAGQVQNGHQFRLGSSVFRPDIVRTWEEDAVEE